ncbi:phage major capsid protein [Brucella anthropi]|uniref:phage major capsid protein n=1 Tax=Brucella anthropi TaxID=529 RepID=UPI0038511954
MDMTRRAYSLLEIKAVNEDERTITGIASTPATDRDGDVVEPKGAVFKLPLPLLWQHKADKPIGHVIDATVTASGIEIVATIAKDVTEEIENAWKLIKAKLVRGLSIGFRGMEAEQIPGSFGRKFTKWEWFELSAVTIPANAEASITSVKQFDTGLPAASGIPAPVTKTNPGAAGKSTNPVILNSKKGNAMATIAEQIAALEASRNAKTGQMAVVMQKSIDEGRSTDAAEQEEFDTLNGEVEKIDGDLKRLRALEKAQGFTAKPVVANQIDTAEKAAAARSGIVLKGPKLEPGIMFARLAKVKALSKIDVVNVREVAKTLYGEDSEIYGFFAKAAVPAASTGNASWAGNLVGDETSLFADFVEWLRPQTILGRFGANGVPTLRRVPFRVPLIGQTSGGSGYWVGEGKAKPLTKFDFSRTNLAPLKVANIAVVTMEVLRDSSPSAEAIVRDQLAAALRERLDIDFINPAKAAVADISPASILNGVAGIPSSGNTADAVRADLKALFGAFIAANNAPTSGVFIMEATTALALSLMTNPLGQAEFPGITMNGGTLSGLPVIVSEYVPDGIVALVNASDIYQADDGDVNVDMSMEASLEMDNAPTHDSDTPTPATGLVSLWQTNSVGFRAERTINWARRRASAVAYLTGVAWGEPEAPEGGA